MQVDQSSTGKAGSAGKKSAKPRTSTATKRVAKKDATQVKLKPAGSSPTALDDLQSMIAMAAYFRAKERNFAPGHELEDWLEAETQIRALHG